MTRKLNLFLFDDGQSAGDAATTGEAQQAQSDNTGSDTTQETKDVTKGKEANSDKEARKQRKAEYEKLVRGDFKDFDDERINRIIGQKFKETKTLESKIGELSPVLDMLSSRYGKSAEDIAGIVESLENDTKYFEEAAAEKGMTVEAFKEYEKMRLAQERSARKEQEQESLRQAEEQYRQWIDEAGSVKEAYPNFDLSEESQSDEFVAMLSNGVDMKHAYEVLHLEELMTNAIAYTAQNVSKKVTDNIQARGNRPQEAGLSSAAAYVTKTDVSKLTEKDRKDIARRVMAGETIHL